MDHRCAYVYNTVKRIPLGKVSSYGTIAKLCGIKNSRLVGKILHSNPDPKHIPCHRVVRSDGRVAAGYALGGKTMQGKKLREEGVDIQNGIIDLSRFGMKF